MMHASLHSATATIVYSGISSLHLRQQYCMAVKYHHNNKGNNINESINRSIDQSADADQSRRAGQQGTIVP